jgi:hypothetical protein
MPSNSLVLTIEKDADSFEAWDRAYNTPLLTGYDHYISYTKKILLTIMYVCIYVFIVIS